PIVAYLVAGPVIMPEPTTTRNREFKLLIGVIGLLLILGLAALVTVVLLFRVGPMRGHPPATPTPSATATHGLIGESRHSTGALGKSWVVTPCQVASSGRGRLAQEQSTGHAPPRDHLTTGDSLGVLVRALPYGTASPAASLTPQPEPRHHPR